MDTNLPDDVAVTVESGNAKKADIDPDEFACSFVGDKFEVNPGEQAEAAGLLQAQDLEEQK